MNSLLLLSILCQTEDMGSVKINIHNKKHKKLDTVELVDSSFVPTFSKYRKIKHTHDRHELVYVAKLPMNGSVSLSIDMEQGIALGSIRFPGENDQFYFLNDCKAGE